MCGTGVAMCGTDGECLVADGATCCGEIESPCVVPGVAMKLPCMAVVPPHVTGVLPDLAMVLPHVTVVLPDIWPI